MEYLVYSYKEVYSQTNNGNMFVDGATVNVFYYDGKKFSSRLKDENELAEYKKMYDDAQIIFKGEVDENLVEFKDEGHYETFYEARYWMEFGEKQREGLA